MSLGPGVALRFHTALASLTPIPGRLYTIDDAGHKRFHRIGDESIDQTPCLTDQQPGAYLFRETKRPVTQEVVCLFLTIWYLSISPGQNRSAPEAALSWEIMCANSLSTVTIEDSGIPSKSWSGSVQYELFLPPPWTGRDLELASWPSRMNCKVPSRPWLRDDAGVDAGCVVSAPSCRTNWSGSLHALYRLFP